MELEKIKKAINKKHPGSQVVSDSKGLFYIQNGDGKDIANLNISKAIDNFEFDYDDCGVDRFCSVLNSEPTIPHSETVLGAWNNAYTAMKAHHIIGVNNDRFNPDKIRKDIIDF